METILMENLLKSSEVAALIDELGLEMRHEEE